MRGQALVEFALVLPLLLLLTIGVTWASVYLLHASRFDHAAREAAVAAAIATEGENRCSIASEAAQAVLEAPAAIDCAVSDSLVTIRLTGSLTVPPPLDAIASGDLTGIASAMIRTEGTE